MTREDLNEYKKIECALMAIENEIAAAYDTRKSPSLGAAFRSTGDQSGPVGRALERIEKLKKRRDDLNKRLDEIENFVDSIDDPEINAICTLHYLSGFTWEATCLQLRKHTSGGMLMDKVRKYFQAKGFEA